MKTIWVCLLVVLLAASTGLTAPVFYVCPNAYPGPGTTNDVLWQAALGPLAEWDFNSFAAGGHFPNIGAGPVSVNMALGGLGGESGNPEFFAGSWGGPANGATYGTVNGIALLNRDRGSVVHSDMVFRFDVPITGIGAWLYDDGSRFAQSFVLEVTEVGGGVYTSAVLESGNLNAHFVEGFLGAVSTAGITEARFRVLNTLTGAPIRRGFELDHLQIGMSTAIVPAPGAILLGVLGTGLAGWLRRRGVL